jgi:hypothetical protein
MTDAAWYLGQCCFEGDDLDTVVRFRELPPAKERRGRPRMLILKWEYAAKKDGMPKARDLDRMNAFEDDLEVAVEATGLGFPAACLTGNGRRTWRYFVRAGDEKAFLKAVAPVLEAHGPAPFVFRKRDDADWEGLVELLPLKDCDGTERFAGWRG